ncbi:hypothetical protein C4577_01280 [Candidatus Parcubacteria bacterium]|nr:MAG: hypothetical protein C4577_01280 [Candidatus Parcubacteria bacterium]
MKRKSLRGSRQRRESKPTVQVKDPNRMGHLQTEGRTFVVSRVSPASGLSEPFRASPAWVIPAR